MASLGGARGAERVLFGRDFRAEVDELVGFWREAQLLLVRAAADPQLLALIGGGPENIGLVEERRRELLRQVDRELAARALVEAGACLEQLKQSQEARTLYREVLDKHRAWAAAAEAQTRLAALVESANGSQ